MSVKLWSKLIDALAVAAMVAFLIYLLMCATER